MTRPTTRWASRLTAPALLLGGLTLGTVSAPTLAHAAIECEAPASSVTVFSFNDFHGRVEGAAALFTTVEDERDDKGDDGVLLLSAGDNIGGSTFVSMSQEDVPTLDVLNAVEVDAITAGNHEFDKGWADLGDRVIPYLDAPTLAANVYDAGTTDVAEGLDEYVLIERGGLTFAVVGAVTGSLPTLVSPAGITDLDVGEPVAAINRVVAEIADDPDIDVIIASLHEGAPDGSGTIEGNAAASGAFNAIANNLSADVDLVFNGHTHQRYAWETTTNGTPILQAGEYAGALARVEIGVDAAGDFCGFVGEGAIVSPAATVGTQERIVEIQRIVADAVEASSVIGARPVGFANQAVSTPGNGGSGTRNVESPMSNLVAQMFHEQLGDGDPEFIGVQNPGGTRTSFDRGTITYEEAALVLPFANSLMTTELTGAQFKKVLEQQWQRDENGQEYTGEDIPSRLFLALGLSENVTYTYDESRAWGDRITSISVNGAPMDPAKRYTVGSGSFLISGGDNFWEFGNGTSTADTGRVDLEAWVEWIGEQDALEPDYTKRGVSLRSTLSTLTQGRIPVEFTLGQPLAGGLQVDTLDMLLDADGARVSPQLENTSVSAWINDELVGGGTVTDGVATVQVAIPYDVDIAAGANQLQFVVEPSGTVVTWPVNVVLTDAPETPIDVYTMPGIHNVNDRRWMTACEDYSVTERCWTYIWATTIEQHQGHFIQRNGWAFNNLTYLPSPRSVWADNPLGNTGSWTADDGRRWRTECDTPATGRNGCRSYAEAKVVEVVGGTYRVVTKEIFNNIVRFS